MTPIFLHFGLMHILFNMMWLHFFGRQIETVLGSRFMIALVLIVAILSNTRITSYNVCYTKLLRVRENLEEAVKPIKDMLARYEEIGTLMGSGVDDDEMEKLT